MSNDRRQIEIERNLRKLRYLYVRKKMTKAEAKMISSIPHRFTVKKEDLAQAVAACELDPSVVRSGKRQLFEERFYDQVFPNADPNFYLPRYWLVKHVSSVSKESPERAYAKWLVTNFVWREMGPLLRRRALNQLFWQTSERHRQKSLVRAIESVFQAAGIFFKNRTGGREKWLRMYLNFL